MIVALNIFLILLALIAFIMLFRILDLWMEGYSFSSHEKKITLKELFKF